MTHDKAIEWPLFHTGLSKNTIENAYCLSRNVCSSPFLKANTNPFFGGGGIRDKHGLAANSSLHKLT